MARIALPIRKKEVRSCDGCTKCCEGWLGASINGEQIGNGKACSFVDPGVGCKNYEGRPKDPCKTFVCMWKATETVPEEFKPSKSGIILHGQEIGGIQYLNASEAGKEISPLMLSWFLSYCVANMFNVHWVADGKDFWMGSDEFGRLMAEKYRV